jgi:hypothetical protein
MQVYTVLFDKTGSFLMAKKLDLGYFFYDNIKKQGAIVKSGQVLNGAGKAALPGGKLLASELIRIEDGAYREFKEETHYWSTAYKKYYSVEFTLSSQKFCAVYFGFSEGLPAMLLPVNTNLGFAKLAVSDIQKNSITEYDKIFVSYPNSPLDNELDVMSSWNVFNTEDWEKVKLLKDDSDTNWYYWIIDYLKNTIVPDFISQGF